VATQVILLLFLISVLVAAWWDRTHTNSPKLAECLRYRHFPTYRW
jgi:hypothetical protein